MGLNVLNVCELVFFPVYFRGFLHKSGTCACESVPGWVGESPLCLRASAHTYVIADNAFKDALGRNVINILSVLVCENSFFSFT